MDQDPPPPAAQIRNYEIYESDSHLFAKNADGDIAKLGDIAQANGKLGYTLRIDGLWGEGFLTTEKLLQDVAAKLAYTSLDKEFTTLTGALDEVDCNDSAQNLTTSIESPGDNPRPGSAARR